jgi:hypothetical protein
MASCGYFQSHSVFTYDVVIEEINKSLSIQCDELAIMKTGSLSLVLIPVKAGKLTVEALGGLVLARAQSLQFIDLDYSYSFVENALIICTALYVFQGDSFGYQAGKNAKIEIYLIWNSADMRKQDLSGGGTFSFQAQGLMV